jgi:protocatechuate 3,4-dioxygenase beta subunit
LATTRWGGVGILGLGAAAVLLILAVVVALRPSGSKVDSATANPVTGAKAPESAASLSRESQAPSAQQATKEATSAPSAKKEFVASPEALAEDSTAPRVQHLTRPIRLHTTVEGKGDPIAAVRISGPITAAALNDWKLGKIESLPVVGITGADGLVSITAVAAMGKNYGGRWSLIAEAAGYQTAMISIPSHESTSGTPTDNPIDIAVEMRAAGSLPLRGRVVDESGAPIEGAVVLAGASDKSPALPKPRFDSSKLKQEVAFVSLPVRTGSDGVFVVPEPPAIGDEISLTATAAGFEPGTIGTQVSDWAHIEIALERASHELLVRVESPDGEPLPGATVHMSFSPSSAPYPPVGGITDEKGELLLLGLPRGHLDAYATHPDHFLQHPEYEERSFNLTDSHRTEHVIRIPRSIEVEGKAFEASSGNGVGGVLVSAQGYVQGFNGASSVSDHSGRFRIKGVALRESMRSFVVEAPSGYQLDYIRSFEVKDHRHVPQLDVPLIRTTSQDGIVYAADGSTPVPDAEVRIDGFVPEERRVQKTDASGRFRIEVKPGSDVAIMASHPDHGKGSLAFQGAANPGKVTGSVSVTLREPASVSGRVRNREGKPIQGVLIASGATPVTAINYIGLRVRGDLRMERTDASGEFLLKDVTSGSLVVTVSVENYHYSSEPGGMDFLELYQAPEALHLDLKPGETRTGVDFTLEESLAVTGVVTDEAGKPIPDVSFWQWNKSGGVHSSNNGQFRIKVDGEVGSLIRNIRVTKDDYQEFQLEGLFVGGPPVEITLKSKLRVPLRVTYEDGRPVTSYLYRGLHGDKHYYYGSSRPIKVESPEGKTSLPLSGITEAVEVITPLNPDLGGFVPSTEGNELVVVLRPRSSIYGKVASEEGGTAVAGATVKTSIGNSPGFDPEPVVTDENGEFRLGGIIARPMHLEAEKVGMKAPNNVPPAILLNPGGDHGPVTLPLNPLGAVRGIVRGRNGLAAAGLPITLTGGGSDTLQRKETDATGRYEFPASAPGQHDLEVLVGEGLPSYRERFEIPMGVTIEKNIDLTGAIVLSGQVSCNGVMEKLAATACIGPVRTDPAIDYGHIYVESHYLGGGPYEFLLVPGKYQLKVSSQSSFGVDLMVAESFEVLPSPERQTRNFDICLPSATIVVVFPTDRIFAEGKLSIESPNAQMVYRDNKGISMKQPSIILTDLLPIPYEASFKSLDGVWEGKSEAVHLKPGQENLLVISVQRTKPAE